VAGKKHFPDLAKKVVALGRDWYTFELQVCGKNRKFLYRARNLNHTWKSYSELLTSQGQNNNEDHE
jgi:hypothetical protein